MSEVTLHDLARTLQRQQRAILEIARAVEHGRGNPGLLMERVERILTPEAAPDFAKEDEG